MHDDDPGILGRMLKWLYTLELSRNEGSWTSDLQLWLMADKYGLTGLMDDCQRLIVEKARSCVKDEEAFAQTVDAFVEGIEVLFIDLPDRDDVQGIREDVVEIAAWTIAKTMGQLPVLEDLMREVSGFGKLLIQSLSRQQEQRRRASTSSLGSISVGSGSSASLNSPQPEKLHIPMNEDSEDEFD